MSRRNLTITEIYRLVSKGKDEPFYSSRYFYRYLSVLNTFLFIRLGIGSNLTTIISLVAAIAGAAFLHQGNCILVISGIVLLHYYLILDHVDGELARYEISVLRKKKGPEGPYLDAMVHYLLTPVLFFSFALMAFNKTGDILYLWCGITTSIWFSSFPQAAALRVSFDHLFKTKSSVESIKHIWIHDKITIVKERTIYWKIRKLIREVFSTQGQIIIISIAVIFDMLYEARFSLIELTLYVFGAISVLGIFRSIYSFYIKLRNI